MNLGARALLTAAALAVSLSGKAATITLSGSWDPGDPSVSPRPFRDSTPSTCAAPGTHAGTFAGNWPYDTYVLYNDGPSSCVTVTHLSNATLAGLFVVAYNGSGFNPLNLATNWLGDSGSSGLPLSFSFVAPAYGAFTLAAVGANATGAYSLSVSGDTVVEQRPANRVPEPGALTVLVLALGGVAISRRRT